MQTKEQIIKRIILDFFPASTVLLFGSRARLDYQVDSDFDLLVIINNKISVLEKREYKAKIRRLLAREKIPVDILIQSKNEVKIKQNITGHILKQAIEEGIRL